jgi:hypothetical protein
VSHRFAIRTAAASLVMAFVVACSDAPSSPPPDLVALETPPASVLGLPNCNVIRIFELLAKLAPRPLRPPNADLQGRITSALAQSKSKKDAAQKVVLILATELGKPEVLSQLRDPNGAAPPTRSEAVGEVVTLLFQCVQLPPPPGDLGDAYTADGGVAVIGSSGGSVKTNDEGAGLQVPAGAVTGDHLFAIIPLKTLSTYGNCLPPGTNLKELDQCYHFSVTPNDRFAKPVRAVICTFAHTTPHGPSHEEHDYVRIAKVEHDDPTKVKVYDRKSDPFGLDCADNDIPEEFATGFMDKLVRFASRITKPFRPSVAYAIDGVGADFIDFSNATTVYPIAMRNGFEDEENGEGRENLWSATGFWHRDALADMSNSAFPSLVNLGGGDESNGVFPGALSQGKSLWYGEASRGHYGGELYPEVNGGLSLAPSSGASMTPYFAVPNAVNSVRLSFLSWWEIEGVNPCCFDLMTVGVERQGLEGWTDVLKLNPTVDDNSIPDRSRIPYTSGGFNRAPVTRSYSVDLTAYRGQTIRLRFLFETGDQNYNGFRGWIVDDVIAQVAPEGDLASSLVAAPNAMRKLVSGGHTFPARPAR